MPDLATISAALGSLKTATEIVKFLRESDLSIEKAELKLKLADLLGALADIKIELVEVQDTVIEKDKIIKSLEQAFEIKDDLVRNNDAYYKVSKSGEPVGPPYCSYCWENSHIQRQLVLDNKNRRTRLCTSCNNKYDGLATRAIQSDEK